LKVTSWKVRRLVVLLLLVLVVTGGGASAAPAGPDVCVYVIDEATRATALAELYAWLDVLEDGALTGQMGHIEQVTWAIDELDAAGSVGCGTRITNYELGIDGGHGR
jgi:hypothetical protein